MRTAFFAVVIAALFCFCSSSKKVTTISYPEKFEGLTQLVLASETKTLSFTDTTVQKILMFKVGSAQVRVTASVTFDFYLDFDKDGYKMHFNGAGDTLAFEAPLLRVKKPVINNSQVTYPEKHILINEQDKAIQKLESLTEEFIDDGEELLREEYVIEKCREMLKNYLMDLCKKMGYPVKVIIITFPQIIS
jgi:hypothetical protein